jgi:predicted transcriptional regulator
LVLKRGGRNYTSEELVTSLRASPSVVEKALDTLIAAGLAGGEKAAFRYMPINSAVAALVEETEQLYKSRPDRVRRLIVASSNQGLVAFSDAFRLKD